jgi:hypothetical protein
MSRGEQRDLFSAVYSKGSLSVERWVAWSVWEGEMAKSKGGEQACRRWT